jgi:voltage-gated potassium channel Kch
MLFQVLLGSVLILLTTVIHAGGMSVGLRWLKMMVSGRLELDSFLTRSLVVGTVVFTMFTATIIEASVWATTYIALGVLSGFEEALYFSTVTYTTLGYGDVVLADRWRLLSSFQAANGVIMFGWTTAVIIVAIQTISKTWKMIKAVNDGGDGDQ